MNENTKIGGSHTSKEECKKCGCKWERYRLGSFDWEYEDCIDCRMYEWRLKFEEEESSK